MIQNCYKTVACYYSIPCTYRLEPCGGSRKRTNSILWYDKSVLYILVASNNFDDLAWVAKRKAGGSHPHACKCIIFVAIVVTCDDWMNKQHYLFYLYSPKYIRCRHPPIVFNVSIIFSLSTLSFTLSSLHIPHLCAKSPFKDLNFPLSKKKDKKKKTSTFL